MLPDHTDAAMSGAGCAALALTWPVWTATLIFPALPSCRQKHPEAGSAWHRMGAADSSRLEKRRLCCRKMCDA